MEDVAFSLQLNPPEIGENTVDISKEFGYLEMEIEELILEEIIA